MLYSMTGYGRAEGVSGDRQIVVEIKSLNGKSFELNHRFLPILKPYETSIRQLLQRQLKRGSIDASILIKQDGAAKPMQVNTALARHYFHAMQQIANELQLDWETEKKQLLPTLMRMPEIVAAETDTLPEKDWLILKDLIADAANQLMAFRRSEGAGIAQDIRTRITNIADLLDSVPQYEPQRINRIRQRIETKLAEWTDNGSIDDNRLEQELIFYIEKIDISEEKQRLSAHCRYFLELMDKATDEGVGKKLGFVLQEIGREINTLGSKANDSEMQKIVVNMKDELEKAKEQILNIL